MAKRPTIYDVAQRAGVSKSLVSLVLNGSPSVSAAKQERVRQVIAELGYRPSRAAATLAAARTFTVGLVIDDFSNPWFVSLLQGLRSVLAPEGFHVAVRDNLVAEGSSIDAFLDTQIEALVVAAEPGSDRASLGIPTVLVGHRLHSIDGALRVAVDEALGARLALDHLHELGHRAVGHVTGAGGSARARMRGYLAWCGDVGQSAFVGGEGMETTEEGGYLGTLELLERHPEVSAVFAANDTMALGARAALRERGREVPGDVALAGYDNSSLASSRYLDLTSVDLKSFEVGRSVGALLLQTLRGDGHPATETVIAPELVVRSSTVGTFAM